MEGAALQQLERVAARPGCIAAVGMPDLHPGLHGPIGAALAFADGVHPSLLGGDAGCGARVTGLPGTKSGGLDGLERRIREVTEGPALDVDPADLFRAAWTHGIGGLVDLPGVPDALRDLAAALAASATMEPGPAAPTAAPTPVDQLPGDPAAFGAALGTVGGGNHFLEVAEVEGVVDRARARAAGLVPGGLAVLAHSGSRNLGKTLADTWAIGPLVGEALARWQADQEGLIRYARVNRLLLTWRMLRALGAARVGKVGGSFDVVHNAAAPRDVGGVPTWLHRKGCAPAEAGQLTVVLGSRGARSYVLEGTGREASLASVAHGAGRKMTRGEAAEKVRAKHLRASLVRTELGSRVICDDPTLLYEEHPDAYKPIGPVVAALEDCGAARRVALTRPLVTVKR
jgi:release factor H-coupled RctB family protein